MPLKLSVIICTFGRSKSLNACLKSLTEQTLGPADFEAIIVYPKTDQESERVVRQYADKLDISIIVDPWDGLATARNLGWKKAKNEIVVWLDDDAIASLNWAKSILETFEKDPEIGGVSGPTIIPENLLGNRDIFSFYKNGGKLNFLGKIWAWLFLDNRPFEIGKLFKSGAWSPGSNFLQCLKINGLKEVDYLEACNMALRKDLVEKVNGFDLNFKGTAEWCEIDLAQKVKKLGYKLVFNAEVRVDHCLSQQGAFPRRTAARERMENFFRFYFRHIFKPRPDYILKFSCYVLFLNAYWLIKTFRTGNINWLSGWTGTIIGIKNLFLKNANRN